MQAAIRNSLEFWKKKKRSMSYCHTLPETETASCLVQSKSVCKCESLSSSKFGEPKTSRVVDKEINLSERRRRQQQQHHLRVCFEEANIAANFSVTQTNDPANF